MATAELELPFNPPLIFRTRVQLEDYIATLGERPDSEGTVHECLVAGLNNAWSTESKRVRAGRCSGLGEPEFFGIALAAVRAMYGQSIVQYDPRNVPWAKS